MCFLELLWGMGESWWAVEMTCNCLRDFLLGGSNAKKWCSHRNKNFFKNNSVRCSMYYRQIKTVKCMWVNI